LLAEKIKGLSWLLSLSLSLVSPCVVREGSSRAPCEAAAAAAREKAKARARRKQQQQEAMADADRSFRRASNDRELSRASTAAFDDAASYFGAGGTTSDGGYASSGAGGREGGGSSVTGGRGGGSPGFRADDGADMDFDDDMDDMDDRPSLYSRSLSASSSRRSDITDPLDDFLKRYTISIMPEETVAKLKKR
jgi:hypothetical protein